MQAADLLRRFYETGAEEDYNAFHAATKDWTWQIAYQSIHPGTPNREMIADEVTNVILLRIHSMQSDQRWSPEISSLGSWLRTLVWNCVRDEFRRQTRRALRRNEYADEIAARDPEPHVTQYLAEQQAIEEREFVEKYRPPVQALLQTLSPYQQAVIRLRFFESQSFPKIGDALGVDHQKVRRDTYKTLAILRGHFPDDGGCAA